MQLHMTMMLIVVSMIISACSKELNQSKLLRQQVNALIDEFQETSMDAILFWNLAT
jgi:hypothetical protein